MLKLQFDRYVSSTVKQSTGVTSTCTTTASVTLDYTAISSLVSSMQMYHVSEFVHYNL